MGKRDLASNSKKKKLEEKYLIEGDDSSDEEMENEFYFSQIEVAEYNLICSRGVVAPVDKKITHNLWKEVRNAKKDLLTEKGKLSNSKKAWNTLDKILEKKEYSPIKERVRKIYNKCTLSMCYESIRTSLKGTHHHR